MNHHQGYLTTSPNLTGRCILFLSTLLLTIGVEANNTYTWSSHTQGGSWTDPDSWGGIYPGETIGVINDIAVFKPSSGYTLDISITAIAKIAINSIQMINSSYTGAVTVSSKSSNLWVSGLTVDYGTLTINLENAVALELLASSTVLNVGSAGTLIIKETEIFANKNGDAAGDVALILQGPGLMTLSGINGMIGISSVTVGSDLGLTLANADLTTLSLTLVTTDCPFIMTSGTTVNIQGTTNLGGSLSGDGTISLSSGSKLAIYQYASETFNGTIEGDGALYFFVGKGETLTLDGTVSYTGSTEVQGTGTLALSGSSSISNSSSLTLDAGIFNISNTTSGTTIPTLTGNSNSLTQIILGSKTLTIDQADATTFAGVISGAGAIILGGDGTLTLSNIANSYTGDTTIDSNATLNVTGSIAHSAELIVNSGGTVTGTGSIPTTQINDGGTINAGNSPGAITVSGDLTMSSGATDLSQVGGLYRRLRGDTQRGLVFVTGDAALDGTLEFDFFQPVETNLSSGTFSIVQVEGSITGTFNDVVLNTPNLYGATATFGYAGDGTPQLTISINPPTATGLSGHALTFYNRIKGLYTDPAFAALFEKIAYLQTLDLSGGAVQAALTQMTPAINATATFVSSNAQFDALNALSSRSATWRFWHALTQEHPSQDVALLEKELLASNGDQPFLRSQQSFASCVLNMGRPGDRYTAWFTPFGDITHGNQSIGATVPFHTYTGGGLLGIDGCLGSSGIIEGALGAARSSIILSEDRGRQTVNYYLAALNGTYANDHFYIEVGLLGAYDQLENRRYINVVDINDQVSSSHNMWQLTPQLSVGSLCRFHSWGVEPFIDEAWVFNFEGQVVEHGAGDLDSLTSSRNSSLLRSEAGIHLYRNNTFANGGALLFRATAAYINKVPFDIGSMTVSLYQTSIGLFEVNSFTETQNLGAAGFELVYGSPNGLFSSIQYDGEFGKGYSGNELQLQIGYSF